MFKKSIVVLSMAALSLYGCGGGSSTPAATVNTGVFIDSAVANVSYQTATQSGTTNAKGEFTYVDGETVTFSIGSLEFPPTTAQEMITPMTMAGATSVTDQTATNIARLLQSLDSDGIPSNGITIAERATTIATSVDFTADTATFETSVAALVADSGSTTTTLITEADAQAHVTETLSNSIVGVWGRTGADGGFNYLILLKNNTFIYAENDTSVSFASENGLEVGTYSYDTATGDITFTVVYDDNVSGGVGHSGVGDLSVGNNDQVFATTVSGNTLTIAGVPLTSLGTYSSRPEVGIWHIPSATAGFNYMLLLPNNTFIYAENDLAYTSPDNGLEVGTYSYDSTAGEITFNVVYDDNNPGNTSGLGDIGTPVIHAIPKPSLTLSLFSGAFNLTKILNSKNNMIFGSWLAVGGADQFYFNPVLEYSHVTSGEVGTYTTVFNSFGNSVLNIKTHTSNGDGSGGLDNTTDTGPYTGDITLDFICDSTANTTTMTLSFESVVASFVRSDLSAPIVGRWNLVGGTDVFIFDRNNYYSHSSGEIGTYTFLTSNLNVVSHFTDGDGTGGIDGASMNTDLAVTFTNSNNSMAVNIPGVGVADFTRDITYNGTCT